MDKKVRVLVVGAAFAANLHVEGYVRCPELATIVGLADKRPERVKELADRYGLKDYAQYDDWKDAIDNVDCDVVDICLPNFMHHDVAVYAFQKGRHVITENPRHNIGRRSRNAAGGREGGKGYIMRKTGCLRRLY